MKLQHDCYNCDHFPMQSVELRYSAVRESMSRDSKIWAVPRQEGAVYVLKHRKADHPVVNGVYRTRHEALNDKKSITGSPNKIPGIHHFCQGCGVGCFDEYEIVRFVFDTPRKIPVRDVSSYEHVSIYK